MIDEGPPTGRSPRERVTRELSRAETSDREERQGKGGRAVICRSCFLPPPVVKPKTFLLSGGGAGD